MILAEEPRAPNTPTTCAYHARRGDTVFPNRTLLSQAAIEAELLEILQQQLLTPAVLARVLATANARLRAQAAAARPPVKELRRALKRVQEEIANYRRAVENGISGPWKPRLGRLSNARRPYKPNWPASTETSSLRWSRSLRPCSNGIYKD